LSNYNSGIELKDRPIQIEPQLNESMNSQADVQGKIMGRLDEDNDENDLGTGFK
jgi:hypothetical protein